MLQFDRSRLHPPGYSEPQLGTQLEARALLRIFRREWPILAGSAAIFFALGLLYVELATPRYTASFLVLIDAKKSKILSNAESSDHVPEMIDTGVIESQVEILKSDGVARTVVQKLDLVQDRDFSKPSALSTLFGAVRERIRALLGDNKRPPTEVELENAAVETLIAGLNVKRIGLTYVIDVSYTGTNPLLSAKIATELSDAYMVGELEAKYRATTRATKWLQDRIEELRDHAAIADHAVQQFKADNHIVDTSRGLMNKQQLTDVTAQLVGAKATTAEAKARLERVNEVSRADTGDGSVADALHNEVITRLRGQYLDFARKEAELSAKYGKDHGAVVGLRNQMNELRRSMSDELRRIAAASRSDYEIALARENSVQQSLEALVTQASTSNHAQVQLRDLESSATTYRALHNNFLQKFEEATQTQTFPVPDARLITAPIVPDHPSWPKTSLILPGSIIFGLVFGIGIAVSREFLGNKFCTAADVRAYTGLECLGILPSLKVRRPGIAHEAIIADEADPVPFTRYVLSAPFSGFAETIRNMKISIDISRDHKQAVVVGIVSAVPREGKTTIAANLALLTAEMGHHTLLIDGDLHNPSLTGLLAPRARAGIIEVLTKGESLADVVCRDAHDNLGFVPAVVPERRPNSVALLTSPGMVDLLASARAQYDYIIIDLPPVVPVVDVKAAGHVVDHFIFLIEWGQTTRDAVQDALRSSEHLCERVIGVVLNKAPPGALRRFESYKGRHYRDYYIESDAA